MATPARHFPSFGGRSPGNPPSRLFLNFPHPRNRAGACPDPGCTCRLAPELAPPNLDVQVPGSPPTHCFYFNYTPAAPKCPHLGAGRRTVALPGNHQADQLPTPRRANAGPHQVRGGGKKKRRPVCHTCCTSTELNNQRFATLLGKRRRRVRWLPNNAPNQENKAPSASQLQGSYQQKKHLQRPFWEAHVRSVTQHARISREIHADRRCRAIKAMHVSSPKH